MAEEQSNKSKETEAGGSEIELSETKVGLALKDWIAICLSSLALSVSVISAYFNFFREIDDVRLILGDQRPLSILSVKGANLRVGATYNLLLMNAGNRTAAITDLDFVIHQPRKHSSNSCDSSYALFFSFDPIIIKPGEMITKTVDLKKLPMDKSTSDFLEVPVGDPQDDVYFFTGCLRFTIATPSILKDKIIIPVAKFMYDKSSVALFPSSQFGVPIYKPNEAITLYKH